MFGNTDVSKGMVEGGNQTPEDDEEEEEIEDDEEEEEIEDDEEEEEMDLMREGRSILQRTREEERWARLNEQVRARRRRKILRFLVFLDE
jgi:hypothetical protein